VTNLFRGQNGWRLVERSDREWVYSFEGNKLLIRDPGKDVIAKSIESCGWWEPAITRLVCSRVSRGMNVCDIGAHIGYYTVLFAGMVGEEGEVHAFEPSRICQRELQRNVTINRYKNVCLHGIGLGKQEVRMVMGERGRLAEIGSRGQKEWRREFYVEVKALDSLRGNPMKRGVDFAKIDVEGMEWPVLQGMTRTLRDDHPELVVEIHRKMIRDLGSTAEELIEWLRRFEYNVDVVDLSCSELKSAEIIWIHCT